MKKLTLICIIIFFSFVFLQSSVFADENNTPTSDKTQSIEQINDTNDIKTDEEADSIINDVNNPIEYDASSENIKDKNFTPKEKPQEPNEKIKPQEQKKETNITNKEVINNSSSETAKNENTDAQNELNEKSETNPVEYIEPEKKKVYSQDDYEQMYRDMPVPTHSYMHGVDPEQYYEMKDATWSPYPLLRLNSPIYFKTITILPGYYLLTPREYKGDWYVLFKESGRVKYIIPTFSKEFVDEFYYRDHLKELDMTRSQRWQIKFLNAWGKFIKSSKRKPAIKTNLELTDLDNNFLLIDLYYGFHKYSMVFRVEKY